MVQLLIKLAKDRDSLSEWTIVELQGDLECKHEEDALNGKFIGDLHFTKKGQPVFIIGHHVLFGKFAQLDKPFVILLKADQSAASGVPMETEGSLDEMPSDHSSSDAQFCVTAVIRQKIVFKTRPKPIITNVPKKV